MLSASEQITSLRTTDVTVQQNFLEIKLAIVDGPRCYDIPQSV